MLYRPLRDTGGDCFLFVLVGVFCVVFFFFCISVAWVGIFECQLEAERGVDSLLQCQLVHLLSVKLKRLKLPHCRTRTCCQCLVSAPYSLHKCKISCMLFWGYARVKSFMYGKRCVCLSRQPGWVYSYTAHNHNSLAVVITTTSRAFNLEWALPC